MKHIQIVNFGMSAPRFLPMIEMFMAFKLDALGCERVDISTCFPGDEEAMLTRLEELRGPETCVVLWESKSAKSHHYIENLFSFARAARPRIKVPLLTGGYWATSMADFYPDLFAPFDTVLKGFELNALAGFLRDATAADLPPVLSAPGMCDWNAGPLATQFLRTPDKYVSKGFLAGYQTTFACPNNCYFCYNNTLRKNGAAYSSRDVARVADDVARLKALYGNLGSVQFKDLNFFHESERAIDILRLFREEKVSIGAYLDITVEDANEDVIRAVAEQGCEGLFFGLESFDFETRRRLNKPYTDERLERLFELGDAYQIFLTGSVLTGLPWQSAQDVRREIRTAIEAMRRHDYLLIGFNSIRPVLGTELQTRFFPDVHTQVEFKQYLDLVAFRVDDLQERIYGDSLEGINIRKVHAASVALKHLKTVENVHCPLYLRLLLRLARRAVEEHILSGGESSRFDSWFEEKRLTAMRRSLSSWCRSLPGPRLQKRPIV